MARNKKLRKLTGAVLAGLGLIFGLLGYGAAMTRVSAAGPITVDTTADELNTDGDCSLREAIQAANTDAVVDACAAGSGADVITFSLTTPAVITLTLGELTISADPLTINGPGANLLTIDGNSNGRVFNVTGNVPVVISGMTVRDGNTVYDGGALLSIGDVTLEDMVFQRNISGDDGGAINVQGSLVMTNTAVLSNSAAGQGGGINTALAAVTLTGGRIENNTSGSWAGGLYTYGTLTISGTRFISNSAQTYSGAIFAWEDVAVTNGLFERNTARTDDVGGVFGFKNMVLTDTRFISNTAQKRTGALFVYGNTRISGGEFAGNEAQGGTAGALNVDGTLDIDGTRFVGNRATGDGGALWYALDTIHIANATFAQNHTDGNGGAIEMQTSLIITNTDFLSNTAAGQGGAVNTSGAAITITGGKFENNVGGLTGALYTYGALTISGTHFISNSAQLFGGGILAWQDATITNARFERNSVRDYNVGALYVDGNLQLTNTDFISNTAGQRYGGAWVGGDVQMVGGTFAGNVAQKDAVGALKVDGALTADGATFIANRALGGDGGALDVRGNLTLTNTDVLNNSAAGGAGGINSFGADVRLSGGDISFNTATGDGGGMRADGTLTVGGTTFKNNTALTGGAIDVANTGWFTGAVFTDNTAVAGGGALNVSGSLWLTTTNFANNTAATAGGAVWVQGDAILSNTEFIANEATAGSGGGLYAAGAVTATFALFENNTAGDRGGGLYADGAVTLSYNYIINNGARTFGGGVFSWQTVDIAYAIFYGNTGWFSVGALYADADATITNANFSDNFAAVRDGAVWVGGDVVLSKSAFWDNVAQTGRAGALDVGGSLWLTDTTFLRNYSGTDGGAVVLAGDGGRLVNALFARNSAEHGGSALYLAHSGTVDLWHNTISHPGMYDSFTADSSAILVNATGSVAITNSILLSLGTALDVTAGAVTEDYNLFHQGTPVNGTVTRGGHSVTGDPNFVNLSWDDYHLAAGSWAINAGIASPFTTDFEGNPRPDGGAVDIGFLEAAYTSDAAIAKTVTVGATPAPGDPITYTLTFSNAGDSVLYGVTITDEIPSGITGAAFTATGAIVTDTGASPAYVWQVEDLPRGASGIITVTGMMADPLAWGVFTNTAEIATTSPDVNLANNISDVTVLVINAPPVAGDDIVTTTEDSAIRILPLGNDTDDNLLSVVGVGAPGYGSAVISGTSEIVYTPTLNFNGVDSFIYIISDGALTGTATITVNITPMNDAPVAADDAVLGAENTVIAVSPLGNDDDVDGDTLSVSGVGMPAHGTAVISGAARINYTPDTNFFGTDSFSYIVSDGVLTDTATVTVTVAQNLWFNYLPVIFNNYTDAPDLVVSELIATENTVTVTIKNQGFAPVTGGFWVDVYIAPNPVPTQVNQVWSDVAAEGLVWGVDGAALAQLVPGGTLTLTIGDGLFDAAKSNFGGAMPFGTPVYAQVDSVDLNTTYGGVLEIDELTGAAYNNIAGTTVGAGSSVLPAARRFAPADESRLPER